MQLRRVYRFKGSVGFTVPRPLAEALKLQWQDYVEIYLLDPTTLAVKKHEVSGKKGTPIVRGKTTSTPAP